VIVVFWSCAMSHEPDFRTTTKVRMCRSFFVPDAVWRDVRARLKFSPPSELVLAQLVQPVISESSATIVR